MKLWQLTLISLFITTHSFAGVKAYFNYNPKSSYTDPYRGITRPGDNLEAVILKEIASAKKSIYVAVQEIRLPLIAKALVAKKAQGVDVRVVIEHDYNFNVLTQKEIGENQHEATKLTELIALVDLNRDGRASKAELENQDAIYILKAGKVPMMDDTFDTSSGSGLMHHKFMVVDGKSTIVSSANFTLSCIHGDILSPNSRGNANSLVQVDSIKLAEIFTEEFSELWGNGKDGNFGQNKAYRAPKVVVVGGTKLTVQFSPTSKRLNWGQSVNGLMGFDLARAKKSILAALFVYTDQKLSDIIGERAAAGVKVGILVEAKFAFRDYSELFDMAGVAVPNANCNYEPGNNPWSKPGKEFGVPGLNSGDVLHHKFAVVDSKTVIIGSQNWSDAANYVNDETSLIIENPAISDQFTQEYARLRNLSRMGIPATVQATLRSLDAKCAGRAF